MVHRIVVEDQSLRWYGRPPKIADDSIEFVRLQFHLPEDWDPLVLVAQFTQADTYNMLLDGDTCFLPKELTAGLCKLSLFGYTEGKPLRATSIPLVFQIEESGFVSSAETPIPPTPDLYAQLIEYFSIKPEDITAAIEDYLTANPPETGATEEEAAQIEQNRADIKQLATDLSNVKSPFFVPIEWNEEDDIFTTRITYAEIGQAFHAERPIYAKTGENIVVPLLEFSENGAIFAVISDSSFDVLVVQPDNTVAITSTEFVSWEALDEKLDADKLPEAIDTALAQYQETDPTVPSWAKQSSKPSYSKSEVGLGNVDNVRQYSANNPPPYPVKSVNGKTGAVSLSASDVGAMPSNTTIPSKTSQLTNDSKFATEDFVTSKIAEAELGGEDVDLSGYALKSELPTKVSQLQNDKGYLTAVPDGYAKTGDIPTTPADIGAQPAGNYALKSEIPSVPVKSVNGKTGAVSLSASDVGAMPSSTKIPSKVSELTNDSGYITGYTETDPTVPSWAKAASKPSYSKSEVGLGNVDNVKQYSASNPPPYPVTSVNGKTGAVTVDVPTIPKKVSAFTNDAGYITGYTETDPTVPSWAKAVSKPNYTASEVGAVPTSRKVNGKALSSDVTLSASDVGALSADSLPEAIDTALEQAKTSGEFDGDPGQRGTGILKITTAPSSYTTATGGFTPTYRIALSTVLSQAKVTEVLVGDTVGYSYYHYPVGYVDSSYVYLGTRVSIRGATGAAGDDGKTPVKGTDYWTSSDKTEMVNAVLTALPTWTGGSY